MLLLMHHFILAGLILFTLIYFMFSLKAEHLIYTACSLLVATFAWCFWSWFRVTGNIFDPYTLFMASVFLFNGSAAFLHLFHYSFRDSLGVTFTDTLLLRSLLLVILSMAVVHYGSLLATRRPTKKVERPAKSMDASSMCDAIYRVGIAMLLISLIPFIVFIRENIFIVAESGYGGIFEREAATGFGAWSSVLSGFFIPGIYFLLIGGKEKRYARLISILLLSIYALTYLFIGSRNRALLPVVVFLWLWNRYISRFRKASLLIIVLLLVIFIFIAFPLVKTVRNIPGEERSSVQSYLQSLKELKNPVIGSFAEMGGSFRTIVYTLTYVPTERDYDYGASYIYAIYTIVPNFIWKVHPTIARGTWADWLVMRVDPYTAGKGGGYGFSFVAEAYANFGWLGLALMFVLGYFLAKLTLKAIGEKNPATIVLLASFLPQLLFFARGESALLVRSVTWYALFPYLCAVIIYKSKIKASYQKYVMKEPSFQDSR